MVIERPDRLVEQVPRAGVVLPPNAITYKEVSNIFKQFKVNLEYPATEAANRPDLLKSPRTEPYNKPTESDSTTTTDDDKQKPDK